MLGNNRLWGYDKQDCRLTVVPEQAAAVKLIFELYATGEYGLRRLSEELTRRGYTLSLIHILDGIWWSFVAAEILTVLIGYVVYRKASLPLLQHRAAG